MNENKCGMWAFRIDRPSGRAWRLSDVGAIAYQPFRARRLKGAAMLNAFGDIGAAKLMPQPRVRLQHREIRALPSGEVGNSPASPGIERRSAYIAVPQ